MSQASFLEQKRASPFSLATVVLMHGAAVAALLLVKYEDTPHDRPEPIKTYDVIPPADPPEAPPPDRPAPPQHRSVIDRVPPRAETPLRGPAVDQSPIPLPPIPGTPIGGETIPPPRPIPQPRDETPPPAPPVRIDAQFDPRYADALQPDYPAVEERAQREGSVVIRVTIGPDGRVKGADKVRATSDAFYRVTERHALTRWRFRPATLDGRPVEATKTMTVTFRLQD